MDVEKTIEFILEHQAKFEVRLQQLGELHAGLVESQSSQQQMVVQVISVVRQLADAQQETDRQVKNLGQQVQGLGQQMKELGGRVDQVSENLNALIKVVDDVIRHDGRHPRN